MAALDTMLVVALVANGLLAGLFFAFSCAVSPALGRLDDRSFVEAFRSINTVIVNGWFLAVFLLAPLMAVAAAATAGLSHRPSFWWLVAGAACAVATFVITAALNVPLNQALDAALTTTTAQYETTRTAFETAWNRWNLARTLTSLGALALLAGASVR
ncbi:DUF1772 domain-containing protein [Aeromicrobium sp. YIM 150415]|uniref:anthrone oxygenase family protein n=1 Tax=Aeromicrobium sp. YIM 150415 TaxID=2803912 RepID=UPI001964C962|nr:anthrone oxygenase family protein [Aeromicrobium sp. YIM 150415]MBM9465387.1 DUF1772 domain-containing protein [Aeromicrobium sp. YIM 150415]